MIHSIHFFHIWQNILRYFAESGNSIIYMLFKLEKEVILLQDKFLVPEASIIQRFYCVIYLS